MAKSIKMNIDFMFKSACGGTLNRGFGRAELIHQLHDQRKTAGAKTTYSEYKGAQICIDDSGRIDSKLSEKRCRLSLL